MRRLPLVVYLITYVTTFLIGAIGLLASSGVVALAQLFAGADPFYLTSRDVFYNLVLATIAPLLLTAGYELRLRLHSEPVPIPDEKRRIPALLVLVPWFLSITWTVLSLGRASAFENLGVWRNYRAWVKARWQLFDALGFFEFVNLYLILAITTALVVVWILRRDGSWVAKAVLASASVLPMIAADLLLFQKKTLLVSVILVGLTILFDRGYAERAMSGPVLRRLALLGTASYVLYCVLVVRPSIGSRSEVMAGQPSWLDKSGQSASEGTLKVAIPADPGRTTTPGGSEPAFDFTVTSGPTGTPLPVESPRGRRMRVLIEQVFPGRWVGIPPGSEQKLPSLSRGPALALYALFGPVVRTPLPALVYPALFPDRAPFYGLDAGLDVIGLGRMPTDNILVHRILWPRIQGGTIMVPFQYGLFSQVGLGGALLLALPVGYALAFASQTLITGGRSPARAAAGALILILSIYLAGDSLRNSLIASYGVFWGLAYLFLWSRFGRGPQGFDATRS